MIANPEMLKIKTKDDQLKELQRKTEKHYHEIILKSLYYYRKNYKSLSKKQIFLNLCEFLFGSSSTIISPTLSIVNPCIGIPIARSSGLITSSAILITNEYISNLIMRYTKLRDWINVISLLYEKTLKQSMVDWKTDDREFNELEKIYNRYLDKITDIMKITLFKVVVFGDTIGKESISPQQITKLNNF